MYKVWMETAIGRYRCRLWQPNPETAARHSRPCRMATLSFTGREFNYPHVTCIIIWGKLIELIMCRCSNILFPVHLFSRGLRLVERDREFLRIVFLFSWAMVIAIDLSCCPNFDCDWQLIEDAGWWGISPREPYHNFGGMVV